MSAYREEGASREEGEHAFEQMKRRGPSALVRIGFFKNKLMQLHASGRRAGGRIMRRSTRSDEGWTQGSRQRDAAPSHPEGGGPANPAVGMKLVVARARPPRNQPVRGDSTRQPCCGAAFPVVRRKHPSVGGVATGEAQGVETQRESNGRGGRKGR